MYSLRCDFDAYELVHLSCVAQRGFVWCNFLNSLSTLRSCIEIILNCIVWSFIWREIRMLRPLFEKRFVLCDAFTSDGLFYITVISFQCSLWIIHFIKWTLRLDHLISVIIILSNKFSLDVSSNVFCSLFFCFCLILYCTWMSFVISQHTL